MRTMRILTNFRRFPQRWRASSGECGEAEIAPSFAAMRAGLKRADAVLVDCDPGLVFRLAALFLAWPPRRRPLIAMDLVLRKPETPLQRLAAYPKRLMLSQVDHFIHYFKDWSGYERYYGIGVARSTFVPFKANLMSLYTEGPRPEGEYVLCFGRSLRDFDTFFAAVERLPYPAAIVKPDFAQLHAHGSKFTRPVNRLPQQVRLLEHAVGDIPSQIDVLRNARLVVIPLLRSCLVGVGSYLNAMLMGKCVIVSEGPATRGMIDGEAIVVPPEDPAALGEAIRSAWEDRELRERTAAAGHKYALSLGGEPELIQRVIDRTVEWLRQNHRA